jgi:hypothetical protein
VDLGGREVGGEAAVPGRHGTWWRSEEGAGGGHGPAYGPAECLDMDMVVMVVVSVVVRWSDGQVVRWSDGQVVRWSDGQVVRWSGGQMVR